MRALLKYKNIGFLSLLAGFIAITAALISPQVKASSDPNNDVIRGGVTTLKETRASYRQQADVRALYNRFGVTEDKLTNANVDNVTFHYAAQGEKGSRSVGRINYSSTRDHNLGSFAGTTFYSRSASEWSGSSPAYSFGKLQATDGKYYYVWILKDCGNIAYRPAEPPKQPETPPVATPDEVACTALRASVTSGKKRVTTRLTGEYAQSKPGLVQSFTFDFGDGTVVQHDGAVVDYEYKNDTTQAITYRATFTVNSSLGDKTSPACAVTIQVLPEICPTNQTLPPNHPHCGVCPPEKPGTYPDCKTPVTPVVTQPPQPPTLPKTGPAEVILGGIGTSLLGFSGYQYFLSRRRLFQL